MIQSFVNGFCKGFLSNFPENKSNYNYSVDFFSHESPRPKSKNTQPAQYKVPLDLEIVIEEEPLCLQGCVSTTTTNSKPSKKKSTKSEPKQDLPNNVREFKLPDGSVIYINTEETEMTEESVIDSIIKPK